MIPDFKQDPPEDYPSIPVGAIQPVYFHDNWLPIVIDGAGNGLAIDFAPGPNGLAGQVITYGSDEITKAVVAKSFEELLGLWSTMLTDPTLQRTRSTGAMKSSVTSFSAAHLRAKFSSLGSKLTRSYEGKDHVVDVVINGYEYEGVFYSTLSSIAKKITGEYWDGLVFFGITK